MKTANTDTLEGLFKEVYGDAVIDLVPNAARTVKDFPFVSASQQEGNKFNQPVRLSRTHGWTLSTSGEAFALNEPEPGQHANASVQGSSFVLRDAISLAAAVKLSRSGKDKRAFVEGTSYLVEGMSETAAFVLELQNIFGQSSIGTVDAQTNDSGDTQTFSFTSGTFVAAIWSGLENGFVEFYTSGGSKLTSTPCQVDSVDLENLSVTFTGVEAQLDAVAGATNPVVYLRGTKDAGMVGLRTQVSNNGNMFGIDGAQYSLWQGNTKTLTSAAMSFVHLLRALNKPVNRGLMSDVLCYQNPSTWTDMMNDIAALKRIMGDKGSFSQGSQKLSFEYQGGAITLVPHIFMFPSEMLCFPKGKGKRVGASELTFNMPGVGKVWENLTNHAGVGIRCFWNQAIFLPCPNQCLLINGIKNTDQQ